MSRSIYVHAVIYNNRLKVYENYVLHKRIKIVFNVFFKKGLIWNLEIFEMHFHFSDISLIFMIFLKSYSFSTY